MSVVRVALQMFRRAVPFAVLGLVIAAFAPATAQTLKAVKDRGKLMCGVSSGLMGFSAPDDKNTWSGFDVDFCRAVAAALFDDPSKVEYVPLSAGERFEALQEKRVDLLSRNSTWTLSREAALNIVFAAITYFDGQGFLVSAAKRYSSGLELDNVTACFQNGTTHEGNLADYFAANGMRYRAIVFDSLEETIAAYEAKKCDIYSADISQLHAVRIGMKTPDDHDILADVISKEPLGPVVRQGDDQWFNIVKWTHYAMINGEELGVGMRTIAPALRSAKPDVKRLVGTEGNYGEELGLTKDWAARILRHVGHYGEVFERNVGTGSKLGIPRGINQLWTKGGIQYAPPIR